MHFISFLAKLNLVKLMIFSSGRVFDERAAVTLYVNSDLLARKFPCVPRFL